MFVSIFEWQQETIHNQMTKKQTKFVMDLELGSKSWCMCKCASLRSEFDSQTEFRLGSVGSNRNFDFRGLVRSTNLCLELVSPVGYVDDLTFASLEIWIV